jgi:hypothetical protein
MLTGKRSRLIRSASKQRSEENELKPILLASETDAKTIHTLSYLINTFIQSIDIIKPLIPVVIGCLVTLYSLHEIELKLKFFISCLSKLLLLKLFIFIGFLFYLKIYARQLINSFNNIRLESHRNDSHNAASVLVNSVTGRTRSTERNLSNLLIVVKKKENLYTLSMILLISLFICIFYAQMCSLNNLNKKLALKKQHQHDMDTRKDVSVTLILNETEYFKNKTYYDDVFQKLYQLRKSIVKPLTGKCHAETFQELIFANITKKQSVDKNMKNFEIFNKIENFWLIIFKTIFITYFFLLFVYFLINFILNYINKFDHFVNKNIELRFNATTLGIRSVSASKLVVSKSEEFEQPHLQLFQKNKSNSLKKVSSLISIKSEHAKSIKSLQKLKQHKQKSNDSEPFKWLFNDNNAKLIERLNLVFKSSINDYIENKIVSRFLRFKMHNISSSVCYLINNNTFFKLFFFH